ncbi:MAG: DMT family transporter [Ruminococcaceae bacterium]|nr:DMT family transporter [Oscillospiraceae bacterium]
MSVSKSEMSTRSAILWMTLVSVMWSIAGVIFKYINCNSFVIAGVRSFISALTVLVYMLLTKKKFVINKTTILNAFWLALTFFCFVGANKLTSSANAIVLQYTAPVFVLLYQSFFKKLRSRLNDVICVAITFVGILIFFFDSIGSGNIIGDIIAVISGIGFAAVFIVVGDSDETTSINGILQGQLLTALIGIPFVFFTRNTFDTQTIGLLLILGIVQLGIPYTIVAIAGPHCPALASTLVTVLEPLLNPVWVALIYHEIPSIWSFIGGVIVISNVLIWCVMRDRRKA